jgi:hypothetical protein
MSPAPPVASSSALTPTTVSSAKHSFHTLSREARFRYPPTDESDVPALDELVKPHIDSFNALLEDPASEASGGGGLLGLAVRDITEKVIFDSTEKATGNRLSSAYSFSRSRTCPKSKRLVDDWGLGFVIRAPCQDDSELKPSSSAIDVQSASPTSRSRGRLYPTRTSSPRSGASIRPRRASG